ncbi:MAG: S-layer homology domain-containing protein [Gemmatimonadetes bacterium]|nr:S-layer homology domain-containing protein [Gemmatimonadota bacterium]
MLQTARRVRTALSNSGRKVRLSIAAVAVLAVLGAAGVAIAQGDGRFRDVPSDHYGYDHVQWAVQNGITTGCGDGTSFCADDPVNLVQSVTFLSRYDTEVIDPIVERIDDLEERLGVTRGDDRDTGMSGEYGFGDNTVPTTTTAPPREFIARGSQATTRSYSLPSGTYKAELAVQATAPAADHNEDTDEPEILESVVEIRVEYLDRATNDWVSHAFDLSLTGTNLPAAGSLVQRLDDDEVKVRNSVGDLPPSGSLRVSAYARTCTDGSGDQEAARGDGTCSNNTSDDRTTKYKFSWSVVLTEVPED